MKKALFVLGSVVLATAYGCLPARAWSPSFDCSKARLPAEIVICRDWRLAELDTLVAAAYSFIKSTQGLRAADALGIPYWRQRNNCAFDEQCIKQVQITEINAFPASGPGFRGPPVYLGVFGGSSFEEHRGIIAVLLVAERAHYERHKRSPIGEELDHEGVRATTPLAP